MEPAVLEEEEEEEEEEERFLSLRVLTIERIKDALRLPADSLQMFAGMSLADLGVFERFAYSLKDYLGKTRGFWNSDFGLKSQPKEIVELFHRLALSRTSLLKAVILRKKGHACAGNADVDPEYDIAPDIIMQNPEVRIVHSGPHKSIIDAIAASPRVRVVDIFASPGCLQKGVDLGVLASHVEMLTFSGVLDLAPFFKAAAETGAVRVLVLTDWVPENPTLASNQVATLIDRVKLSSLSLFPAGFHDVKPIARALEGNNSIEVLKWNSRNVAALAAVLARSNCSIWNVDFGECCWSDISFSTGSLSTPSGTNCVSTSP